jgi:dTDP-4-dehydrorhamnose 3,5-epimerase
MIFKEKKIKGVFEIFLDPQKDRRGFFMRTYDEQLFSSNGLPTTWIQENLSFSKKKGVIRGLHFQKPPHDESKFIRVIKGAIFDVFVDLRKDSKTFCHWGSIELTENSNNGILLPKGIAHGFCTLTDKCMILYKHDNYYNPESTSGIIWNDKILNINWPTKAPILSSKDKQLSSLKNMLNIL